MLHGFEEQRSCLLRLPIIVTGKNDRCDGGPPSGRTEIRIGHAVPAMVVDAFQARAGWELRARQRLEKGAVEPSCEVFQPGIVADRRDDHHAPNAGIGIRIADRLQRDVRELCGGVPQALLSFDWCPATYESTHSSGVRPRRSRGEFVFIVSMARCFTMPAMWTSLDCG